MIFVILKLVYMKNNVCNGYVGHLVMKRHPGLLFLGGLQSFAGDAAIHKILHKELKVKKIILRWVPLSLREEQKAEGVRISKQTLVFIELFLNCHGWRNLKNVECGWPNADYPKKTTRNEENYVPCFLQKYCVCGSYWVGRDRRLFRAERCLSETLQDLEA